MKVNYKISRTPWLVLR